MHALLSIGRNFAFGKGDFLVLRTNLGVAVKIFRFWFTKLLDIDDTIKDFFLF
jgi:hypothetical protein